MAKGRGKNQRQKEESRHAYLVRSYEQEGFAGDSAGYYFSKEEAEDVKREFEKLYPDYEYSIEEFERHQERHSRPRSSTARRRGKRQTNQGIG